MPALYTRREIENILQDVGPGQRSRGTYATGVAMLALDVMNTQQLPAWAGELAGIAVHGVSWMTNAWGSRAQVEPLIRWVAKQPDPEESTRVVLAAFALGGITAAWEVCVPALSKTSRARWHEPDYDPADLDDEVGGSR